MKRLVIVLTNGYADWECAFLNGIGSACYGLETVNVAPDGESIRSQGGLQTIPDGGLDSVHADEFNALVLCGGMAWTQPGATDIKGIALEFLNQDKHVAAICGGTLALANAGILDRRRHTSNDQNFLSENSPTYSGQSHYVDVSAAVVDRNVITAAGSAPTHFSAAVFRAMGVDNKTVDDFIEMLAREHSK